MFHDEHFLNIEGHSRNGNRTGQDRDSQFNQFAAHLVVERALATEVYTCWICLHLLADPEHNSKEPEAD
jgi:hypothetical protein